VHKLQQQQQQQQIKNQYITMMTQRKSTSSPTRSHIDVGFANSCCNKPRQGDSSSGRSSFGLMVIIFFVAIVLGCSYCSFELPSAAAAQQKDLPWNEKIAKLQANVDELQQKRSHDMLKNTYLEKILGEKIEKMERILKWEKEVTMAEQAKFAKRLRSSSEKKALS
jgi:hypothetical protein